MSSVMTGLNTVWFSHQPTIAKPRASMATDIRIAARPRRMGAAVSRLATGSRCTRARVRRRRCGSRRPTLRAMPTAEPATEGPSFKRMLGRALLRRCPWCGDGRAWFPPGLRGWFGRRCRGAAVRTAVGPEHGRPRARRADDQHDPDPRLADRRHGRRDRAHRARHRRGSVRDRPRHRRPDRPVIAYPFGYTIWMAIDLAARRPTAEELAERPGRGGRCAGVAGRPPRFPLRSA